jgi:predicted nucleic acid-binding protein
MVRAIVVSDTSVLVNFLRIDRMDLIAAHPASFIATDHVATEITETYPEQQARYFAALNAAHITEQRIDDLAELEIFMRVAVKGRLGAGERAPIAIALNRQHCGLAIDDSRAIQRAINEAEIVGTALLIVRTQDIVVELIRNDVVSVEAADAIRVEWATHHRFKLKIASFRDLLSSS